jgi:co-chaperonin GroES (HSP10)
MDYSKIKPLHGIIVLKMKTADVTEGGIILAVEKQLDEAEVVAVGPGEWIHKKDRQPEFRLVGVNVGDSVVIGPGSGVTLEVEIDGEKELLTFLSETDIVAVVKNGQR